MIILLDFGPMIEFTIGILIIFVILYYIYKLLVERLEAEKK
tara:strand:+ start:16680 stop:16802 length:123 start_codon:yes stop_codon:yes gene_type:complete